MTENYTRTSGVDLLVSTYNLEDYHMGLDFSFCSFADVESSQIRMSDMVGQPAVALAMLESVRELLLFTRDSYLTYLGEDDTWPRTQMDAFMVWVKQLPAL